MAGFDNANAILAELNAQVKDGDVDGGMETLSKLKIAMLDFPEPLSPAHVSIAMEGLEMGVFLAVAAGDLDAFARNFAQLQPYYASSTSSEQRKCHMLGLNLMCLLVENRLSEFHAEMELLTEQEASSTFVSFPITLERQLMVGSYDEVLNAGSRIPDKSYEFFMDNLLQTVRESIADCMEVSYKTMKVHDATKMMKFTSIEAFMEYVKKFRDDWIVEGDSLCFQPPPSGSKASDIPSMKLIAQSLSYAGEMERII